MTRPRAYVIAQARMSSTRLPGKVLMDLGGEPLFERVLERAARASLVDGVVLATTVGVDDDKLAERAAVLHVPVYRGSLDDVLSRYVGAAKKVDAEIIVRITCDCPFVDPAVIDACVAGLERGVDYSTNTLHRTFPIGLDVEAFTRDALERAHEGATTEEQREHVTPYFYQHPESFRLHNVEAPAWAHHPDWRLTVDTAADLELARRLYTALPEGFTLSDVVREIERDPSVLDVNRHIEHRHTEKPTSW